jgi:hypothetical protein
VGSQSAATIKFRFRMQDGPRALIPARSAQSCIDKNQFNGGGGLQTHISFTRIGAQPSR